jgi:hypothetical protein
MPHFYALGKNVFVFPGSRIWKVCKTVNSPQNTIATSSHGRHSQGNVFRSCALLLAKASGQLALPGADTPYLDRVLYYVVCVVFVCRLRLDFLPLSVVLGALGSLNLLSIHTIPSVCYPRPYRLLEATVGCGNFHSRP